MSSTWKDEAIIPAVITASDELFPGYKKWDSISQKSCCTGWSCACESIDPLAKIAAVEPLPLSKESVAVPFTDTEIATIAEITARDLENDDDEPTQEEIALLQKMFGV